VRGSWTLASFVASRHMRGAARKWRPQFGRIFQPLSTDEVAQMKSSCSILQCARYCFASRLERRLDDTIGLRSSEDNRRRCRTVACIQRVDCGSSSISLYPKTSPALEKGQN
jgi:hypothetical protein